MSAVQLDPFGQNLMMRHHKDFIPQTLSTYSQVIASVSKNSPTICGKMVILK